MKLVGATNWFVRGPFMLEGLFCGLAGALLAVFFLVLGKAVALPAILAAPLGRRRRARLAFPLVALILLGDGPRPRRRRLRPDDPPLPPGLSSTDRPASSSRSAAAASSRRRAVLHARRAVVLDTKGAGDLERGDLAVVRTGRGRARVEQRLGPADRIENVLEALLVERGARQPFEPHELAAIDVSNRVDLRDLLTYTIDPDTAKDFDDALSFRREADGIRAWVHIADVSWFVGAGTPLDHGAARARVLDLRPGRGRADAAARARRRPLLAAPDTRTGSASRSRSRRTASRSSTAR